MTVSKLCRQIEERLKSNHTEKEVIQNLCTMKPGEFRIRLIGNDDMKVVVLNKKSRSTCMQHSNNNFI